VHHLTTQSGWRLVADDILPFTLTPTGPRLLPHFPQLKLPANGQPVASPERVPLRALVTLEPGPVAEGAAVTLRALEPLQAALSLLRHTAAARLFDRPLAARHLDCCADLSASTPAYEVTYPFSLAYLPRLAAVVSEHLEDAEASRKGPAGRPARP
jgi:hypothetical protein